MDSASAPTIARSDRRKSANQPSASMSRINWPLWIGASLVLAVLLLAASGSALAPQDPVKPNYIVLNPATGEFVKPPFAAFVVPGFPLGTDPLGRDILSQVLWAVRPTLTLVLLVTALRLVLGTLIGLTAGWGHGRLSRLLESMTSLALIVPVFLVALCLIAAFSVEIGVWAFILGLCLTGWAETARIVHDQTRLTKTQPFVEAARALGSSDVSIVGRHVLPHIMPVIWILLPFEVSAALLVTAGLGFLGYFVNAIWVPLGDYTAMRASGQPELGQMLATGATMIRQQPWELLVAGIVVFVIVLGFNLLGEGLRLAFDPRRGRRRKGRLGLATERLANWMGDVGWQRVATLRASLPTIATLGALALLIVGGGIVLWQAREAQPSESAIAVPGLHLWAADRHDAQGTFWATVNGPSTAAVVWTFDDKSGFTGGPAVAADGTLYLAAKGGTLYALDPDGAVRWQASLLAEPVGAPALNAQGEIYVLDEEGRLYLFTLQGEPRWISQPETDAAPIASPIVDGAGVAYYPSERSLIAVQRDGQLLWRVDLPTYSYISPQPALTVDGKYVLFQDIAVDAASGVMWGNKLTSFWTASWWGPMATSILASQGAVQRVALTEAALEISPYAQWDVLSLSLGVRLPGSAGVTPDGRVWVYYTSESEYGKLLWVNQDGEVTANINYPWRGNDRLLAVDRDATAYTCGTVSLSQVGNVLQCGAYSSERNAAIWRLDLGSRGAPVGGALVPGRLYVTTNKGELFAIGEASR